MCKNVRVCLKTNSMNANAQIVDAFTKGLEIRQKDIYNLESLLGRALELLQTSNDSEPKRWALVEEIKQQLKIS